MEDEKVYAVNPDLYFLMHKCLSGGPLKKTLQAFREEFAEINQLPTRIDWTGNEHDRTIEDMERQYSNIRPDYLLQLCYRASASSNASTEKSNNAISLLSLRKNFVDGNFIDYNFKQLCDFVRRKYVTTPVRNLAVSSNMVNVLRGREISGPLSRRAIIAPRMYNSFQFQRRTLGHLSAVYCLLFDHSGRYIITGADDLLIKLWSSRTGRLIATFRGASSEITDIAVNSENTLLAAGSIDRILRIWDLQSGIPVAVLTGHTGMITSVNFCPSPSWNYQYLITTSTDGSVAFWAYTYDTGGKVNFRPKPTMYQEKMRPGQAQMICSSFSPGGTFLATGSADHHVRVYYMKSDEGPHRILETEAHHDRVDSIEWAHSGLKFLSGSKDGSAIIWSFESQQWKTLYLNMTQPQSKAPNAKKVNEEPRKIKVTMVTWDRSDNWAVTAVSDHTLRIWNSRTGTQYKALAGHTDEVYVLESHPHDNHVILSAGHDGQLFIWDIMKGEIISKFNNTIENQGYGAIFDVKWAPDGNVVAASDSHGHILIFGFGKGDKLFELLPKELFFHTDYRPLVRDANNHVLDEQTQIPPHLMPPPFLVDIDGNPYPPTLQRLVTGREHCNTEQLVPSIVVDREGAQEIFQVVIDENRTEQENEEARNAAHRQINRRFGTREFEGIRQSRGDWQRDPTMKWKKHVLMQPLDNLSLKAVKEHVEILENLEMQEYRRQLCQRPHMINTSSINESKSNEKKKNAGGSYLTRLNKLRTVNQCVVLSDISDESDNSDSSGYSDWVAEEDVNVESPKRTRRRRVNYDSDSDGDEDGDRDESREASEEKESPPPPPRENVRANNLRKGRNREMYKPSEWLTEVRPRKSPYFPQMGDEVVYFKQGHELYLDAVRAKKVYEVNTKTLPWTKYNLRNHEFAKVVGIQYEIKPPRICSLKLALLDDDGRLNGKIFTVKYHDMPDVLDFFVLKQHFGTAMSRNWKDNDKFRCMIDDGWWIGEIVTRSTASEFFPDSPFLCYEIKWDNGEQDRMSPWDMEPLDENHLDVEITAETSLPENSGEALPVLPEELNNILYQPNPDDWPNNNRQSVTKYIVSGLSKVMELAIAEPFLVPVDLNTYPSYAYIVEYPIDLSTIKTRFENQFYRRVTAAQFDIRYLATNAEKFNERHSIIVKHARIITELCLRIVKQCSTNLDVNAIYHQLADNYDSSDTEVDVEILPSSSRMLRSLPKRNLRFTSDWISEAKLLFEGVWDCEDSAPFRTPVNTSKYTDYHNIIKNPMDLSTVKDKLYNNQYKTPHEFHDDMRLIFENSRTYNTNQRSRIYVMTVRLAATFQEHIGTLVRNWRMAKRREHSGPSQNRRARSSATGSHSSSPSSSSSSASDVSVGEEIKNGDLNKDSDSDEEDTVCLKKLQKPRKLKIMTSDEEDKDPSVELDAQAKNGHSSTSTSSSDKKYLFEESEQSEDSGETYNPPSTSRTYTRSKRKKQSSSEDETSESSDDDLPLSSIKKHKNNNNSVNKRYKIVDINLRQLEHTPRNPDVITSVSSRGRVRRMNPRVTAVLIKK